MGRFYFHFRQNEALAKDEQGAEFDTVEEAFLSAFRAAQDMWRDLLVDRRDPRACSFEVMDAEDRLLFVLPFTEVLDACKDDGDGVRMQRASQLFLAALQNQEYARRLQDEMTKELDSARSIIAQTSALLAELRKFDK